MKVDGRCHCGAVTFEAEADPTQTTVCHCTDCQSLTGTAFRVTVRAAPDSFRILSGKPAEYEKIADSGNKRVQGFCGKCGSPIYSTSAGSGPKIYGLRVGTLQQREAFVPQKEIWCRSELGWMPEMTDTKRFDAEP
jgi:hypothetical protein